MSIKDLPAATRPREKLLAHGAASLADAELLALLLRTGVKGTGVLQLAADLLARFDGFAGLLNGGLERLNSKAGAVRGLGPAKRAELSAVIEIARRSLTQRLVEMPVFASTQAVREFVQLQLAHQQREVFIVLFLDSQMRLLKMDELFHGTLHQTAVYPREIVRRAMVLNAGAVILAHNHPSGVAEPSRADEFLTDSVRNALALVDVRVLDHLVVGNGQVVSFAERGLL